MDSTQKYYLIQLLRLLVTELDSSTELYWFCMDQVKKILKVDGNNNVTMTFDEICDLLTALSYK